MMNSECVNVFSEHLKKCSEFFCNLFDLLTVLYCEREKYLPPKAIYMERTITMNTMKKSKILLLAICGIYLTGCFPSGNLHESYVEEQADNDSTSEIKFENETLKAELELPTEYPSSLPVIHTCAEALNIDDVAEIAFGDNDDNISKEYIENRSRYIYETNNVNVFVDPTQTCVYNVGAEEKYSIMTTVESFYDTYIFGQFFNNNEIEGFSREEAIQKVNDVLNKLGVNNLCEPEIYTVTGAEANAGLSDFTGSEGDQHFSLLDDDEAFYILEYRYQYEGISLSEVLAPSVGIKTNFGNPNISVILSEDELLSLEIEGYFSADYSKDENVSIVVTPKEALQRTIEYLDTTAVSNDTTIYNCELVYIVSESKGYDRTLVPAWRFDISELHGADLETGELAKNTIFINVETGAPYMES